MHQINIPSDVSEFVEQRGGHHKPFDPVSTALIVIDMQNYFMADGEMGCFPGARAIVPNVNRLAAAMRDNGGLVVWVQNLASPEAMAQWLNVEELYLPEKAQLRRSRMVPGSTAFELWAGLDVQAQDARAVKTRYSALAPDASNVEELLRQQGIENVIVAGVATNVCCESTARDAMMRGYRTILVSDATATGNDAEHNASLITFMKFFGDVRSTDYLVEMLTTVAATAKV